MKMKWILIIVAIVALAYVFNVFGLKDAISGAKSETPAPGGPGK